MIRVDIIDIIVIVDIVRLWLGGRLMYSRIGRYIGMGLAVLVIGAAAVGTVGQTECQAAKKKPKKIQVLTEKNSSLRMSAGDQKKISFEVLPKKANQKLTFKSSRKNVVKVSAKGVLTAVKKGNATITLQSKAKKTVKTKLKVAVEAKNSTVSNSEIKAYQAAAVNLAPPASVQISDLIPSYLAAPKAGTATGITLNQNYVELAAGESFQLTATITPVTSTDKVVWTIDHLGGINVYTTGNIFVTEDTPVGTEAIVTATCGNAKATCKVVTVQGPCEHVWGAWATVLSPECMTEGTERSTCQKCSKVRERAVAATGHNWVSKVLTEPTCAEAGERELTCQSCSETKKEIIKAKGHTWITNGTVLEEPTCTKAGKMQYTCTVKDCDGEKIEAIKASGHSWDTGEITSSPTCTKAGQRTYHCTIEGYTGTKKETIDATGHTWTYGEITIPPECEKNGRRDFSCLICSAKKYTTVPKLGHTWDAGKVTKEPTCDRTGERIFTCGTCLQERSESISALGHKLSDTYTTDKEPACTQQGRESLHCTRDGCEYVTGIKPIPMLGHDWDAGVVTSDPTCILPGYRRLSCQRDGCSEQMSKLIPALGHDWTEDYVITMEATCTGAGRRAQICQRTGCTKVKNEQLEDPLGHDWDLNNVEHVDATCTTEGSDIFTCKRTYLDVEGNTKTCGRRKKEILPAKKHSFASTFTVDWAPTCVLAGQQSKHCMNSWTNKEGKTESCEVADDITVLEPLGHTWSAWRVTVQPSHGVLGEESRSCSVCKEVQTRGKAEEHRYDSNGTCQACGDKVTLTQSKISDWEYTVNTTEKTVLLKKYIGSAPGIKIPAQMVVDVDGVTGTYAVKFAGGYGQRPQTGVFASNTRCPIEAVSFDAGVKLENMQYMFSGCTKLKAVLNLPTSVTDMTGTFKGCSSLISVSALPAGLTALTSTFEDCSSLGYVPAIPAAVESMYAAFKNCTSLVNAPVLPAKLTNLSWTFSGCTALSQSPVIPATVTEMTNTFENTALLSVPTDIPAGVKKLTMTFYNCQGLERVPNLPSTIETMEYTFKNCKNICYIVPLPSTVTRKVDVFAGCDKLVQ